MKNNVSGAVSEKSTGRSTVGRSTGRMSGPGRDTPSKVIASMDMATKMSQYHAVRLRRFAIVVQ